MDVDMRNDLAAEFNVDNIKLVAENFDQPDIIPGVYYPEVVERILGYLRTRELKSCRLVNKTWNTEACRALQKRSFVRFHEEKVRSESFLELYERSKSLSLPTPFKQFRVSVKSFKNDILNKILSLHENSITDLYLSRAPSENNSEFQELLHKTLANNSRSLKYLRVSLKTGIDLRWKAAFSESCSQSQPLYLPALEDFGYWEKGIGIDKSACIDFLVAIMQAAPNLRKFSSSCADPKVLERLIPGVNWMNVESIYAESINGRHVQLLSMINAPKLKRLILHSELENLTGLERIPSQNLCRMVGNFSGSVEDLSIVWLSSSMDLDFPFCPHLTHLQLDGWDGTLGVFDVRRLPCLETISLFEHHEQEDAIFSPHIGVRRIKLESSTGVGPDSYYTDEELDFLLLYFRIQYPNLEDLEIRMQLTDEAVKSVVQHFSATLQSLRIDTKSKLSSNVFTGRNSMALEYYVNAGLNLYEIAYMTSLRDMTNLKKIVLGSKHAMDEEFDVSNRIIQYGIGEIPSLQTFHFNWNSNLSASILADSLWYLNEILIYNGNEEEFGNEMVYLQLRLPQVILS